ncbi:MAG: aromatic ring-hydroxylating dioxygenase subunit alpha [Hydrocarboniphaga sp.]|uniref:aromatic ring-hydroxylating oxygenase subunit alpha n=1 Tax=Hydrocarboniphaga sp. TaxID=2033016 RepID=UPI002607A9AB|nr:aromatic ring-hydroxylating dioxygenase subunit alpha [Hydrocarboniphaga sp.]MDB5968695.1 aromatic ring-hydroxylating dioxygenase subunit alpha [Hydrocarboniphaga sp.]
MSLAAIDRTTSNTAGNSGGDWPPSWQSAPHGIRVGRYIDPAFAKLEFEKMWTRVWQVAARLDEIPEAGDYTVYNIGDQSVMLVRVDADTVKAYHNFCPHRGTALAQGCGNFEKKRIVCPFHGWRWNLAGQNQLVLEREEFRGGELRDSDVALRELKSAVFAGFVFINLDSKCGSFDDYIAPVRHWIEDLAIGDMHHYWWKSLSVPANWKVAQEAFFEAYHVSATHPQLEKVGRDIVYGDRVGGDLAYRNVQYESLPLGHARFYGGNKTPMAGHLQEPTGDPLEEMAERLSLIADGMDAMVLKEDVEVLRSLRGRPIPEGSNLGAEYVRALYATAAEQQRPMPKLEPETLGMWGGEIFLFPNFLILPQAGNTEMYRSRPDGDDPNRCIFEIYSAKTYPAAVRPPRATVEHVTDFDDPEQLLLIPRQDLSNIPRIQQGLRSRGMRQTWLAANQEQIILNMHRELDRHLQA